MIILKLLSIIGVILLVISTIHTIVSKEKLDTFTICVIVLGIITLPTTYYYANNCIKNKTVLSGIVKEKYLSTSKSHDSYLTTVEIDNNGNKYIITLNDKSAFNENLVGSKIYVDRVDYIHKKTNSIVETNYYYTHNNEPN